MGDQGWLSGGTGEKDGDFVHTGCWLAALGPCRRRLWGGPGGQLAVGVVSNERGEAVGLWGKMLTGQVLRGYCGSGECLNIGAQLVMIGALRAALLLLVLTCKQKGCVCEVNFQHALKCN